jgi:phosphoserine phosphatase RsbU/P
MKILVADDDRVTCRMLEALLAEWGHEAVGARDGARAWEFLQAADGPRIAILDWLMPHLDGLEVCRKVRALSTRQPPYLILLTVKGSRSDIVAGLRGGADDYLTKPFDPEELRARLQTGQRIVGLQRILADQVSDLEKALARVQQLQGLLPICCYCKSIRDDQNYWQEVESYISAHSQARFSHGVCPSCFQRVVETELKDVVHRQELPHAGSGR